MIPTITADVARNGRVKVRLDDLPPEAWHEFVTGFGLAVTTDDAQSIYAAVPWVHRAVELRAAALAAMPFDILRGESAIYTNDDPVPPRGLEWLGNLSFLLRRIESSLCVYGAAYLLKASNERRELSPRWLHPATMTPKFNKQTGELDHFERRLPGRNKPVPLGVDEVLYVFLPSMHAEVGPGTAPVDVALEAATVLRNVDKFAAQFFERGAIKATLLTVEGTPPKSERDKLEKWWRRFFSGIANAWQTTAVAASVKPVTVGNGLEDLTHGDLTDEKRRDIATALGIPHSLLFSNAANYATAQVDARAFYSNTMIPQAKLIARSFNEQELGQRGYTLRFQPERLAVFQEDEAKRALAVMHLVSAGMTLEQAVDVLGFSIPETNSRTSAALPAAEPPQLQPPPKAEPVAVHVHMSSPTQAPADEPAGGPVQDDAARDLARWKRKANKRMRNGKAPACAFSSEAIPLALRDTIVAALERSATREQVDAIFERALDNSDRYRVAAPAYGSEQHAEILDQKAARSEPHERRLRRMLAEIFDEQRDELVAAIRARTRAKGIPPLGDVFDKPAWVIRFIDFFREFFGDAYEVLGAEAIADVVVGVDFDVTNPLVQESLRTVLTEFAKKLNDTTYTNLIELFSAAADEGLSTRDLIERLGEYFGDRRSPASLERIARTTMTSASNAADVEAWEQSGVVQRQTWLSALDDRTRAAHIAAHGQTVGLREQFDVGGEALAHPGDPRGSAGNIINCRCTTIAAVD